MRIVKNLPLYLTIARIIVIPGIIVVFYLNNSFARKLGALLFVLASVTHFLGGLFARKYNLVPSFGKIFDPIADKLLVGCVMIMLLKKDNVDEIPCLLSLAREFLVTCLREFLALEKVCLYGDSLR